MRDRLARGTIRNQSWNNEAFGFGVRIINRWTDIVSNADINDVEVESPPKEIEIHYIKSNFFRTVHMNGAYGGVTPQGDINANFYSERSSIPQTVTHDVEEGNLGSEIRDKRKGKEGLVREVEVGVMMSLKNAIKLRDWLNKMIEAGAIVEGLHEENATTPSDENNSPKDKLDGGTQNE